MPKKKLKETNQVSVTMLCIPTGLVLVVIAAFVWSTQSDASFHFSRLNSRIYLFSRGYFTLQEFTRNPPPSLLSFVHHSSTLTPLPSKLTSSS